MTTAAVVVGSAGAQLPVPGRSRCPGLGRRAGAQLGARRQGGRAEGEGGGGSGRAETDNHGFGGGGRDQRGSGGGGSGRRFPVHAGCERAGEEIRRVLHHQQQQRRRLCLRRSPRQPARRPGVWGQHPGGGGHAAVGVLHNAAAGGSARRCPEPGWRVEPTHTRPGAARAHASSCRTRAVVPGMLSTGAGGSLRPDMHVQFSRMLIGWVGCMTSACSPSWLLGLRQAGPAAPGPGPLSTVRCPLPV